MKKRRKTTFIALFSMLAMVLVGTTSVLSSQKGVHEVNALSSAITNFSAINGDIGDNWSYRCVKNTASNPAVNSGQVRLYSHRTSGDGNTLVFEPKVLSDSYVMDKITFGFGGATGVSTYELKWGNSLETLNDSETRNAVQNGSSVLEPSSAFKYVTLQNTHTGGDTNLQVHIASITIEYTFIGTNVPVTGILLNKTALLLLTDEEEQLTPTVLPIDATNKSVTWESDDPDVATVVGGLVVGVSVGTATITATTVDGGFSETCNVTVQQNTVAIDKFSAKGFGGYIGGSYTSSDQFGLVGLHETELALKYFNGANGQIKGSAESNIVNDNFSMRNIDRYPGYIRKIIINGTGGTSFTASATRSLVSVGDAPYTMDNSANGTVVEAVYTTPSGGHTLTWTIPSEVNCRYFMVHSLKVGGSMLAAAADAIQIYYEPVEDSFGTFDYIELDISSSDLKKEYFVGEKLSNFGLLVTAYDTEGNDLITNDFTTSPTAGYKFLEKDIGEVVVTVTVTINGIPKSEDYEVEVIESRTFSKAESMNDIRFSHVYAMASPLDGAASTTLAGGTTPYVSEVTIEYDEGDDSFTEVLNLQTVTLDLGFVKGSYAIRLLDGDNAGKYYGWSAGNTLKLKEEVDAESSWTISFDETNGFRITNVGDPSRFICHNHTATRFAAYTSVPTGASAAYLYLDHSAIEPDKEALVLATEVNDGVGEGAEGKCHAAYDVLKDIYDRLSSAGQAAFVTTSSDPVIAAAAARYAYIESWVAANPNPDGSPSILDITSTQTISIVILISILGVSTLAGYYFIRKRPKEETTN